VNPACTNIHSELRLSRTSVAVRSRKLSYVPLRGNGTGSSFVMPLQARLDGELGARPTRPFGSVLHHGPAAPSR
jgi:hypothetical protein